MLPLLPAPHQTVSSEEISAKEVIRQFRGHNLYLFGGVFFSFLVVILALIVSTQRTSFWGRATSGGAATFSLLSLENSYIFASPIKAAPDGTSVVRVTVILLNSQGLGVSGQKVSLTVSPAISVSQTQPISDTLGRAMFDVTSETAGSYTITAEIAGTSLPQKVSVDFQ